MTDDPNTRQLPMFCIAAGHKVPCQTWLEHRSLLERQEAEIRLLLDSIPDALATGRTVQQAAETGQTSITGYKPPKRVRATVEYSPDDIHEVHWTREGEVYRTTDPLVRNKVVHYLQDVRAQTAIAYKGICRAHVFIDGVPDEWNEWK